MSRSFFWLALPLCALLAACAQKPPTVDDVVNQAVKTQGGAAALAAITDQVSTWEAKSTFPMGDSMVTWVGEMTITYKRPNKIKFESKNPDGTLAFASVFDGTKGWQYMMGEVREMAPAEVEETAPMAETWIDGWHDYAQKGLKLMLHADTTMNGETYHVVHATDKYNNVSMNYCDMQTGLVERSEVTMTDPMTMQKTPMAMTFADYTSAGGLMVPGKFTQYDANGAVMFEAALKECQHNTGVSDDAFAAPAPMTAAPAEAEANM